MKFVDYAVITVISGNGGKGAVSFRREKFLPKGAPDGGDGGKGGDVTMIADHNITSLLDFRYKPKFAAESGKNGAGNNKKGRNGKNLTIKVPLGTIITDRDTGEFIADLTKNSEKVIIAKGGGGGKGNSFFKSSTNRSPRFAQPGMPGETKTISLELKTLADIGIIGLPNAGKSTLISKLSKCRPEIASYPFTTKSPNLGVCLDPDEGKFYIAADIPGIMEGAAQGYGLGIKFLKHIERTKILLHVIEIGKPEDVIKRYRTVISEINKFNKDILTKKQIVAINKIDMIPNAMEYENIKNKLNNFFKATEIEPFFISASENTGIDKLNSKLKLLISP